MKKVTCLIVVLISIFQAGSVAWATSLDINSFNITNTNNSNDASNPEYIYENPGDVTPMINQVVLPEPTTLAFLLLLAPLYLKRKRLALA